MYELFEEQFARPVTQKIQGGTQIGLQAFINSFNSLKLLNLFEEYHIWK